MYRNKNYQRQSVSNLVDLFESGTIMNEKLDRKNKQSASKNDNVTALDDKDIPTSQKSSKMKSFFEIKRPNRSPNSTLEVKPKCADSKKERMYKSPYKSQNKETSTSFSKSDNKVDFKRQFSLPSYKKSNVQRYFDKTENSNKPTADLNDIALNNMLVEQFGEKLRKRRDLKNCKEDKDNKVLDNSLIVKDNGNKSKMHLSDDTKSIYNGNGKLQNNSKLSNNSNSSEEDFRRPSKYKSRKNKSSSRRDLSKKEETSKNDKKDTKTADSNKEKYKSENKYEKQITEPEKRRNLSSNKNKIPPTPKIRPSSISQIIFAFENNASILYDNLNKYSSNKEQKNVDEDLKETQPDQPSTAIEDSTDENVDVSNLNNSTNDFTEVEVTKEEIEELRKSTMLEIDEAVSQMIQEGFITEEAYLNINKTVEEPDNEDDSDTTLITHLQNKALEITRKNEPEPKADNANENNDIDTNQSEEITIQKFSEEKPSTSVELIANCEAAQVDSCCSTKIRNQHISETPEPEDYDFGESLLQESDSDNFVVEAYNDEGNELVILQLQISRKSYKFNSPENLLTEANNSDMVFHVHEDEAPKLIESEADKKNSDSLYSFASDVLNPDRLTVYSTTSMESLLDEGISMAKDEVILRNNDYSNARRETIMDHEGNIRIERVRFTTLPHAQEEVQENSPTCTLDNKGKIAYIIDELKATERKYVEDLGKVVTTYIPYIQQNTPNNLIGKSCYIFGNMTSLYKEALLFLNDLEKCDDDPENVAKVFITNKKLFKKYPEYFKNKPKADVYLKEFDHVIKKQQSILKDRLDLAAYLLTPLQRLGKYILLLENIKKEFVKKQKSIEIISEALEIVRSEMIKGNDAVAIESIDNCPFSLVDYGPFIMRDRFFSHKPKKLEYMVFLFEKIIVLTVVHHKNIEKFTYSDSIRLNDLTITSRENEPTILELTDYTRNKKTFNDKYSFVLEAKTEKTKQTWRDAIEKKLWEQLEKAKENVQQLYGTDKKNKVAPKINKKKRQKSDSSCNRKSFFYV